MKFRKKPVVVEATQWFTNGDHPEDFDRDADRDLAAVSLEGQVVRYFRHPGRPGHSPCEKCAKIMHDHGWIDTMEGGHVVCPGAWIITGVQGERYPCNPVIFAATYEQVE